MHAIGEHGARAQPRIGADQRRALAGNALQIAVRAHLRAGGEGHVLQARERADDHAIAQFHPAFQHHVDVDLHVAAHGHRAALVEARRIDQACALHAQRTRGA